MNKINFLLDIIEEDIKNINFNTPFVEMEQTPFVEINEDMLHSGVSIWEQSFRQTGRTTMMLKYLAEDIRRCENSQQSKTFLIVANNYSMGRELLNKLSEIFVDKGYEVLSLTLNKIKFNYCIVEMESFSVAEHKYYSSKYDEIYIDNSVWDLKAINLKRDIKGY
jgi:hypothetical protein